MACSTLRCSANIAPNPLNDCICHNHKETSSDRNVNNFGTEPPIDELSTLASKWRRAELRRRVVSDSSASYELEVDDWNLPLDSIKQPLAVTKNSVKDDDGTQDLLSLRGIESTEELSELNRLVRSDKGLDWAGQCPRQFYRGQSCQFVN